MRDPALSNARDALRDFLSLDEIRLGDSVALYQEILEHEANFNDDVRYGAYFRAAAYGIPGITFHNDGGDRYCASDDGGI